MKQYIKIIDGKQVIKPQSHILVILDEKQYINPSEELILQDGWQEYITKPIEESLEQVIDKTLYKLEQYDSSSAVNICYIVIGDYKMQYWANKNERSVLKTAVQDCLTQGRTNYRLDLRSENISIDMDCETLLNILSALEVYAIDCYNKTTDHIFAIKKLQTIEEVNNYDYTIGYPEKLTFTV